MESRPKGIIGTVIVRSHAAGTIHRFRELMAAGKEKQARELLAAGRVETKQTNLVMASLNNGYDILVQFLLSGYTGSFAFPLGIAWGEIGTGAANPSNLDIAF